MKLIIGLGNPGREYEFTRHNLGFMLIEALYEENFSAWREERGALVSRGALNGVSVILAKPQTFMNLSGQAVGALLSFYKISPSECLVAHDELDLPLGATRAKLGGSSAGHRGVQSIIDALGTAEFYRLRLGMRTARTEVVPAEDYVLEKFSADEMILVEKMILDAKEQIVSELN